jgi:hypothetical protein
MRAGMPVKGTPLRHYGAEGPRALNKRTYLDRGEIALDRLTGPGKPSHARGLESDDLGSVWLDPRRPVYRTGRKASEAGAWDVVARLAGDPEARRRARAGNVVALRPHEVKP